MLTQCPKPYDDYAVRQDGKVYSLSKHEWCELKQNEDEYLELHTKKGFVKVHRLVAMTFIPNPDNLPEVDHIDHDRNNNHVNNLRWVSRQENTDNKTTLKSVRLTLPNGDKVEFNSMTEAAEYLKVNKSTIKRAADSGKKTKGGVLVEYV